MPAAYRVEWLRIATRALDRLPAAMRERIERAVAELGDDPRLPGTIQLEGGAGERRLRVGDYRIIYEIDDDARTVVVLKVAHRREAYR